MPLPLAFFGIGWMELLVVSAIVLLLFGNRLPKLMWSMGRSVVEFKKGVHGIEDDADRPAEEPRKEKEVERVS